MRTNLSCCLGLIDMYNGQDKSTNRLLVLVYLVPHERLSWGPWHHENPENILNICMLLPKALKMRQLNKMALVAKLLSS